VIPADTARLVADMLTAVTGPNGTGAEAAIDGYLVAGKTGTAQKADYVVGGYAEDRWTASFVGFVPAEQPRLVISVVIDEPVIEHYGGVVAGPVFRRVGEAALRHLGVPAATGGEALAAHRRAREAREREEREAARSARAAGAPADESAGAAEEPEAEIAVAAREPGDGEVLVPDVLGWSARAALVAMHGAGLSLDLEGSGLVVSQTPSRGEIVRAGTSVHVRLEPPDRALGRSPGSPSRLASLAIRPEVVASAGGAP
jgi:cell division protein FtsI (penicillin-binding protein 3)